MPIFTGCIDLTWLQWINPGSSWDRWDYHAERCHEANVPARFVYQTFVWIYWIYIVVILYCIILIAIHPSQSSLSSCINIILILILTFHVYDMCFNPFVSTLTFLPPTTAFPACSRLGEQNCIPPFIIRCFRHPEVLQYWGFLTNRIWCLAWKTRNKIKHLKVFMFSILTRWWFQPNLMFIRFFSGEMIQFHKQILQNGLVQPPTSWRFQPLSLFRWNLSTKGMGFVWKGFI